MAAKKATPSKKEKELKENFDKSKQELKDLKGVIKSLKDEIKLLKKNHIEIDDNSNIIRIKHEFEINLSLLSWVQASQLSQNVRLYHDMTIYKTKLYTAGLFTIVLILNCSRF